MLEKQDIISLYAAACDDALRFHEARNNSMEWLAGIISVIGIGVCYAMISAQFWFHHLAAGLGSLIIIKISQIARKQARDDREYFLQFITIKAKYEQLLGLTVPMGVGRNAEQAYWVQDAIIPADYLEDRHEDHDAKSWVDRKLKEKAEEEWAEQLFELSSSVGWVLLIGSGLLALLKAFGQI